MYGENDYAHVLKGHYENAYFCFVNQPSTCPDLMYSIKEVGQRLSAEACKNDPNSLGTLLTSCGNLV